MCLRRLGQPQGWLPQHSWKCTTGLACRAEIVCKIGYIVPDNDDVVDLLISAAKGGAGPFRFGPFEPAKDFRPYSECSTVIQALQTLGHMKNAKAIEFVITVLEKSWKDVLAGNITAAMTPTSTSFRRLQRPGRHQLPTKESFEY